MKYIFLADEFYEYGSQGGAETCNYELINRLQLSGHKVTSMFTFFCSPAFVHAKLDHIYIIGNFLALTEEAKDFISNNAKYFIYEHDHKYIRMRDPSLFEDHLVPKEHIINQSFYKNAYKVVAQSQTHKEIIKKNLEIENVEVGMNLWSAEHIENLKKALDKSENKVYDACYMDHVFPQKNGEGALSYCKGNGWNTLKIPHGMPHNEFCEMLASSKRFVFFPQVLETLSRVSVEANCVNTEIVVNGNVSYQKEGWSNLRGEELIDYIVEKGKETVELFQNA